MHMRYRGPRPESTTNAGELLITANHLCLLNGLRDRPNGEAQSTADLVRAALPYIAFFRHPPSTWTLRAATRTLHPAWAERQRVGWRIAWRLTARGREIVERRVPARIRGIGPYEGLAQFRDASKPERQRKALEARQPAAKKRELLELLAASAERYVIVEDRGSTVLFQPRTADAEEELRNSLPEDARWWGRTVVCEPRLVDAIISALRRGAP